MTLNSHTDVAEWLAEYVANNDFQAREVALVQSLARYVATSQRELVLADQEFAALKVAHVRDVDELVKVKHELELRDRLLSLSRGTIAHLEHGLREHRRVEQNITVDARIAQNRKESA